MSMKKKTAKKKIYKPTAAEMKIYKKFLKVREKLQKEVRESWEESCPVCGREY